MGDELIEWRRYFTSPFLMPLSTGIASKFMSFYIIIVLQLPNCKFRLQYV